MLSHQQIAGIGVSSRRAVHDLLDAPPRGVVGVGGGQAVAADARQLPAPLPCERAAVVGQGVALGVVGDGLPADVARPVAPIAGLGVGGT